MNTTRQAAAYSAAGVAAVSAATTLLAGVAQVPAVLVVVTFLGALTFIGVYLRRHWRTPVGVNLMALAVVMVIETGLAIAALIFGTNWPFRDEIRAGAWALVAYVLWWRVGLLFTVGLGAAAPPPTSGQLRRRREQLLVELADIDQRIHDEGAVY